MGFLKKLFECFFATLAISIVLFVFMAFGVIPFEANLVTNYLIGAGLLIIGQALFLVGVDKSIVKMGQIVGNGFVKLKKLWSVLLFAFMFGLLTTIAEPDVNILVGQINSGNNPILNFFLLFVFGLGVGSFVILGMLKIIKNFQLKYLLLIGYGIIIVLMIFTPIEYIGVSFDGGGVTTGPITSPFLLAMCIALASSFNSKKESSFGMVSLASVGAVIFLMLFFIIYGDVSSAADVHTYTSIWALLGELAKAVTLVFLPLIALFLIYNAFITRIHRFELGKIMVGSLVSFVGLIIFLLGANYGFLPMGYYAGGALANVFNDGGLFIILLFVSIIGVLLVYTEPSINIFAEQISRATTNAIKGKMVTIFIAIGVAIACCLNACIIIYNLPLWAFLLGLYVLCIILAFFLPQLYCGISFDSGGIASGTMAAVFVLPLSIGLGLGLGGESSFGVIAMIAVVPILTLEIMFILIAKKQSRSEKELYKINAKITRKIKRLQKTKHIFKTFERKTNKTNKTKIRSKKL